jgi:uncharacterized protein with FMN-binding domain
MKKILLSFSLIAALAIFATFSRRNVGVGADRFLAPSVSVLATTSSTNDSTAANGPTYVPKRVTNSGETEDPTAVSLPQPVGLYKEGTYTGTVADAYYGNIQVQAVIQNGKLFDVIFLQHPNDRRTSQEINAQAMPILTSEAIQIQSGNVDIVSGATDSSLAFRESMASALAMAKN